MYRYGLLANENSTAVLTYDKLLTLTDINLALWWDTIEATTASITTDSYNSKTVANVRADTVVS